MLYDHMLDTLYATAWAFRISLLVLFVNILNIMHNNVNIINSFVRYKNLTLVNKFIDFLCFQNYDHVYVWNPLICACICVFVKHKFWVQIILYMQNFDFQGTLVFHSLTASLPSFFLYIYIALVAKKQCPILASGHLTSRVEIKDVRKLFFCLT